MDKKRRKLLSGLATIPFVLSAKDPIYSQKQAAPGTRLQYSVNAYSFNSALRSGDMTFFDMMDFAANIGLDAVDLTGYYFSDYPNIPANDELFQLKRKALKLGLNIPWTGIRTDFVNPDAKSRKADSNMVRQWLEVSSLLGASIMRIYAGNHDYTGFTKDEVKEWLVEEFKICARYAEETGVIAAVQHHNWFLLDSDEIIDILKRVSSEWFGLVLDIGSLHAKDPYQEIEKLAPYANYWFIKEYVNPGGTKERVDMQRIASILKKDGYRGYISFESLSKDGDPKEIITSMFDAFQKEYTKLSD